jgi:hypothetical protein
MTSRQISDTAPGQLARAPLTGLAVLVMALILAALLRGSPAIDKADEHGIMPTRDQRHHRRVDDDPDIGAFERTPTL